VLVNIQIPTTITDPAERRLIQALIDTIKALEDRVKVLEKK